MSRRTSSREPPLRSRTEGSCRKGARRSEVTGVAEDEVVVLDLYQVGAVSYNLADLPEHIEVCIRSEPAEQLKMTFDDGTSLLITVRITVTEEG